MRVADTSFLYALFSETDDLHTRAVAEAGKPDHILVPHEILSETLSLIQYRQGFRAAIEAGNWLRGQTRFQRAPTETAVAEAAWTAYLAGRGKLSYPDAVVVAWCRGLRVAPASFDDEIGKRA